MKEIEQALFGPRPWPLAAPVASAIERLLMLDRLGQTFRTALEGAGGGDPFGALLEGLGVDYRVDLDDLARIPKTGPLAIVANHPFGMLEGAVLGTVLSRARPDVKFMANSMLAALPQVRDRFIFVDPFGGRAAIQENRSPIRQCVQWLRQGGALVVFPAGEVARLDWLRRAVVEGPWNPAVARLLRAAGCPVLPVFFEGANSFSFQALGALHPRLGTAALPRELLNKRGSTVRFRIGRLVTADTLRGLPADEQAIEYLRCRTVGLSRRGPQVRKVIRIALPAIRRNRTVSLAEETPAALLREEIGRLGSGSRLAEVEDLAVYLAPAHQIPNTLREIGRLREIAFRAAGEGSNRALDLDRFDESYLHLFLWNEEKSELAGAYRLAATPDILPRQGIRGLYTSTLFHYRPQFFSRIGPAIELGRSFIRAEYQKRFASLLLLWKGIGHYATQRPDCPVLFGAVSISNDYSAASRDLMVGFLKRGSDKELAGLVKPRRPFRPSAGNFHTGMLARLLTDLEGLSDPVADLEPDGKGVPILIRQYMKLGGQMLAFNLDASFSNALDGLILVDLRKAPAAALARYLTREGAAKFLEHHRARCA